MARTITAVGVLLLLALSIAPARAQDGGFGEREMKGIEQALHAINLEPADLGYQKGPLPKDASRLPLVDYLLRHPIEVPKVADELIAPIRSSTRPSEIFRVLVAQLPDGAGLSTDDLEPLAFELPEAQAKGLPEGFAKTLSRLAGAYRASRQEREKAFSALAPEQRKLLENNVLALVVQEEELGFKLPPDLEKDPAPLWQALDLIKWRPIWRSGLFLMLEIERACDELKGKATDWRGTVRVATPEGVIELSGYGPDRHAERAAIIIDLGGDDIYAGPATQAWIVDMGGNDVYRGGAASLGAGILDVRVLWDQEGDDFYEGTCLTEGFGAFGVGILLDDKGNDTYRALMFAQSCSRTWGVGLLADRAGNDVYQAGGKVIHKPLLVEQGYTQGMAQGFSMGYRAEGNWPDRSGGIGILWDGGGDDTYTGGTFVQGSSYWFSFGLLVDDAGNDTYSGQFYAQAAAIHLTVAALIDGGGNDCYVVHGEVGHAFAHDWGVAVLWDKAGDDVYAGGQSIPGFGRFGGVGIFVDSEGDDHYQGPPGLSNPGQTGCVGLFLDLGGNDQYGRGLSDGGLSLKRWSIALDVADPPKAGLADPKEQGTVPRNNPEKWHDAIGSRPLATPEELEKIYTDAALWNVGASREPAWIARRKLIEMGLPAAAWMVDKKLPAAQTLDLVALDAVLKEVGPETGKLLLAPLGSSTVTTVQNALRLVSSIKAQDAHDEVMKLIVGDQAVRRPAISAAGALRLKEAVPQIVESSKDLDSYGNFVCATALGNIGDPAALPWLLKNLDGVELLVREASADALVKLGVDALPALSEVALGAKTAPARVALRALGAIDKPESLPVLLQRAGDADWGVRLTVLLVLKGMKTEGAKQAFDDTLAKEKDPRIKSAIENLDPAKSKW
jgi:hypothetical protein